ncbi:MAG TPA: ion channel [Syntrophales bacterium]|nr:ion channel [Syntrophales bacterium]HOM06691.1 ion channel [Syntrophales bacterium]HOO00121.1 ion channel [Syntrophales bacterium]HPC01613.1 ion channel [Syntrophales bacterium]HPQ06352.1 ion channel [Syntrophales bacterium]
MRDVLNRFVAYFHQPFVQVASFTLLVVLLSSSLVFYFEHVHGSANINSLWDGVWWSIVTMGTVGYGDKYPLTVGGRIVGILLIFCGVGLMSLFTATVASAFVERRMREGRGLEAIKVRDHVVICGWNNHTEEVLQGLTMRGTETRTFIVLVNELPSDDLEALRLKYGGTRLRFLRGDFTHEEVLMKANIAKAAAVVIMADLSGDHPRDRLDQRTTLAALTVKSLAPSVRTVAELIDSQNVPHLRRANVEEIIVRGEYVASLLAGSVNSPGLTRVVSNIMGSGAKNSFRRVPIPADYVGRPARDLIGHFRKENALFIGILKERKAMKLEDILTDDTSVIDRFIRERLREAKREFVVEKDTMQAIVNPDDDYLVQAEDAAIIIARVPSAK